MFFFKRHKHEHRKRFEHNKNRFSKRRTRIVKQKKLIAYHRNFNEKIDNFVEQLIDK